MSYNVGSTVTVQTVARDLAGAVINTPTVTLAVTAPDQTVSAPAVTNTGAGGIYTATVSATQVGVYVLAWSGTGGLADVDQFTVRDAGARLVSLADAKKHLTISLANTTDDDELQDMIDSLSSDIDHICGPMARRTVTNEWVSVCGPEMRLVQAPVISLTTVTAAQTGYTPPVVAGLVQKGSSGVFRRLDGAWMYGEFLVTYVAGRVVVPAAVGEAAKGILAHQWTTTQHNAGAGRPTRGGDDMMTIPGMGFAIPRWCANKLLPYCRGLLAA